MFLVATSCLGLSWIFNGYPSHLTKNTLKKNICGHKCMHKWLKILKQTIVLFPKLSECKQDYEENITQHWYFCMFHSFVLILTRVKKMNLILTSNAKETGVNISAIVELFQVCVEYKKQQWTCVKWPLELLNFLNIFHRTINQSIKKKKKKHTCENIEKISMRHDTPRGRKSHTKMICISTESGISYCIHMHRINVLLF